MTKPTNPSGVILRHATAGDLDRVQHALCRHPFEHGMLLRLPENADDAWLRPLAVSR